MPNGNDSAAAAPDSSARASQRYSNTVTFAYDEGGRRATEALTTGGQTYTVSLDYDDGGRTVEITYPDGTTLDRTYTDRGQLEEVEYESADVASFVYDDGGRETSRTFGNSLVTTTSYITGENLFDTLTNTAVGNYSYTYDANDNKTAETISGVMSGYGFTTPSGYDDEDRLVAWERDDAAQDLSWVLSDVGDWDSYTDNTVTETRTHNDVHELTAIDAGPLTYDAKGNLTADEAGIAYAWDADNMLSEADVPASPDRGIEGTHAHAYAYDALGRRVSKTVDDAVGMTTETTVFVCLTQPIPYSPWAGQVLAEYTSGTAATSPLRKYAYGEYIDEPLVMVDRTAAGSSGAGTDEPFYYHRNQQYSVAALSNSGGSIAERYRYTPYGETTILAPNGTTVRTVSDAGNAYTYTGRRLDGESALHYFRARWFHAEIGRFASRDPWEYFDGASLYGAYFDQDDVDPSGTNALDDPPPACDGVPWDYQKHCWIPRPGCVNASRSNDYCMMLDDPDKCALRWISECENLDDPPKPPTVPPGTFPGYGNYCGPRCGEPDEPKDCLDAACRQHDDCMGGVWNWINPLKKMHCEQQLCAAALSCDCETSPDPDSCRFAKRLIVPYACLKGISPLPVL